MPIGSQVASWSGWNLVLLRVSPLSAYDGHRHFPFYHSSGACQSSTIWDGNVEFWVHLIRYPSSLEHNMAVVFLPRRDLVHDFTYLVLCLLFPLYFGFPFGIRLVQRAERAHIRGWLHLLYLLQSVASVGYFPLTLPRDMERD